MKWTISILAGNKAVLRDNIRGQTQNANYYSSEADRLRQQAKVLLERADLNDASARRACVERNKCQVQLNELDAAIAKLES